jgi:thiol:disulfide interchange protein DsbA
MNKILVTVIASFFIMACSEEKVPAEPEPLVEAVVITEEKVKNIDNLIIESVNYKPGEHYKILENPIESKNNEIIEYFWYKCPHCNTFDKMIQKNYKLLVENNMTLRTEHAAIAKNWVQDAQLFYTLREMKLEKKSTGILMDLFHNNKDGKKTFKDVLEEIGTTEEDLNKVFASEPVIARLKKSYEDALKAGISGTPSIIVEGKYLMSNKAFNGYKELLEAAIEIAKINEKKIKEEIK